MSLAYGSTENANNGSGIGSRKRGRNEPGVPEVCYRWPRGECAYGAACFNEHPDQLDPSKAKEVEYSFPTEIDGACQTCVGSRRMNASSSGSSVLRMIELTFMQCDRKEAGGLCSNCRWYSGSKKGGCNAAAESYNDSAWKQMLSRSATRWDLAPPKPTGPLNPVQDDKMPANWAGKSAEELGQPPSIPDVVLARPRAYLIPPPLPKSRNAQSLRERGLKGPSGSSTPQAPLPMMPPGMYQFGSASGPPPPSLPTRPNPVSPIPVSGADAQSQDEARLEMPLGVVPPLEKLGRLVHEQVSYATRERTFLFNTGAKVIVPVDLNLGSTQRAPPVASSSEAQLPPTRLQADLQRRPATPLLAPVNEPGGCTGGYADGQQRDAGDDSDGID